MSRARKLLRSLSSPMSELNGFPEAEKRIERALQEEREMSRVECPRGDHQFEPRYDYGAPTQGVNLSGWVRVADVVQYVEATRPKTYVRDVCVRCGAIIERRDS